MEHIPSIIYLCSTSTPGIIWIDVTPEDKFNDRVSALVHDGYSNFTGFRYEYGIRTDDASQKYFCICNLFGKWRVGSTNLFLEDASVVKELLSYFEGEPVKYPSEPVVQPAKEIGNETEPTAPAAPPHHRGALLRFCNIGIPVGSTLVFLKNPAIKVTTVDDRNKVEYQGQTYSLSGLAKELLSVTSAQGGKYFLYEGKALTDILKEKG